LPATVVKTFSRKLTSDRWSIRQWEDGSFQIFHDNPYEGLYPSDPDRYYQQVSGRFETVEAAEAELLRMPEFGGVEDE